MEKIDYKKYIKFFLILVKPFRKIFKINPEDNWISLVVLFIVVNILLIVFSFNLFLRTSADEFFSLDEDRSVSVSTLDRRFLTETLNDFRVKGENLKDLKKSEPKYVDPSI
jgi:hypothetical protein